MFPRLRFEMGLLLGILTSSEHHSCLVQAYVIQMVNEKGDKLSATSLYKHVIQDYRPVTLKSNTWFLVFRHVAL